MPLTLPFFTHMEMHNMLLYGTSEFIKGFSGKIYITSCESGQRTQSSHYRGERYEVTLWTVTQILSVRFRILLGIRYTSRFFSLLSLSEFPAYEWTLVWMNANIQGSKWKNYWGLYWWGKHVSKCYLYLIISIESHETEYKIMQIFKMKSIYLKPHSYILQTCWNSLLEHVFGIVVKPSTSQSEFSGLKP